MPNCPNCKVETFSNRLCFACRLCIEAEDVFPADMFVLNITGDRVGEIREERVQEDRCLNCGVVRGSALHEACREANHVFMADLFQPATPPPPPPNLDETSMDDKPEGLGLPGERFDLVCADCGVTKLRLKKSVHGYFYGCPSWPECNGTHGAHPDGRPKGIPGDKRTRLARMAAHEVFDQLFKGPRATMNVAEAYAWMASEMKLTPDEAHIARFTIDQCDQLVKLANNKLGPSAWTQLDRDPFEEESEVITEREEIKGDPANGRQFYGYL